MRRLFRVPLACSIKLNLALVAALYLATPVHAAFIPSPPSGPAPFWNYSIFGSSIGLGGLLVVPGDPGNPPQIIFNSKTEYNPGNEHYWQIARYNPANGNYDQIFVSRIYSAAIKRIALGNVVGDSQPEIVIMLENGRIYLYDLASRAELGYIATGVTDRLEALSLTDLDGDGVAELIVTTEYNLFVFNNTGTLLWYVAGAGGTDVVVGQMDTDPAPEIATTRGNTVVDCATHAIQWTKSNGGFVSSSAHLKLAPLPGASYQQLIVASAWYDITSYDVATQQPRWSIKTPQDIDAIHVADVDNDGIPELLVGDGQGGAVRVHDLITQATKWEAYNPEAGVTNIAVADVDADGVLDLLFGAGWSATSADYLFVANTTGTHNIKWRSEALLGPFIGPAIGDLDGDGKPELVVACRYSEGGWAGPRLLVFDLETLALRAISPKSLLFKAGNDLKVRDLEGDGRAEIILATAFDGEIDVFSFNAANNFAQKWSSPVQPSNSPFTLVEVADLDGNGTQEIIASNALTTTTSQSVAVYIFDYPSTAAPWRSTTTMGTGPNAITGLVVSDLDGNGSKEFAALVSTGDLYTFDGPTRQLKNVKQKTGATTIADRRSPAGLVLGDSNGVGHFWKYAPNNYTEDYVRELGSGPLSGLNSFDDGSLWIGASGRLRLRLPPDYRGSWWQSGTFRSGLGHTAALDLSNGRHRVFSSTEHAVAGFDFVPTPPAPPTVLGNISTRLRVETGDNVLIGGFIVGGVEPKKVIIRAIGPSLSAVGLPEPLANPTLELHGPNDLIASNDDWVNSPDKQAIIDSGVAPTNDFESAIIATLPAGKTAYTAIVRGLNGTTGTGVVEIYDLDTKVESRMANISTRGRVSDGDNVLIAGTIVVGPAPRKMLIRGIGNSLQLEDKLSDPTLELRDAQGVILDANDNWQSSPNKQAIIDTTIPPTSFNESAIVTTLPGNNAAYTAIVRGANSLVKGIGVIEIYALDE